MGKSVKYIFSINPGRSGSHYLSEIFSFANDCCSFHEPPPIGNEESMRRFFNGDCEAIEKVASEKAKFIKKQLVNKSTYVETNHCFIKGFGWYIADLLDAEDDDIGIIILKRNRKKVVESTYQVGCRPLQKSGRNSVLTPEMKIIINWPPKRSVFSPMLTYRIFRLLNYPFSGAKIFEEIKHKVLKLNKLLSEPKVTDEQMSVEKQYSEGNRKGVNESQEIDNTINLTKKITKINENYEKDCLFWYYDEIYALGEKFREKYNNYKYLNVDIDDLNDYGFIVHMVDYFGLSCDRAIINSINKPTNTGFRKRNEISRLKSGQE